MKWHWHHDTQCSELVLVFTAVKQSFLTQNYHIFLELRQIFYNDFVESEVGNNVFTKRTLFNLDNLGICAKSDSSKTHFYISTLLLLIVSWRKYRFILRWDFFLLLHWAHWMQHWQSVPASCTICVSPRLTSRETRPQTSSGILVSWLVARLSSTMLVHVPKSNGREVNWLSCGRQWHAFISKISDNSDSQHKDSAVQESEQTSALCQLCYLAPGWNVYNGDWKPNEECLYIMSH